VLVWLLVQGAALGVSAARVPFFAIKSFPDPGERLALGVMLVAQIAGAAMLFPYLMRDARAAAMVIASSWPFTILAAFLTGRTDSRPIAAAVVFVTAWLLGLALWRGVLRSDRATAVGVCVAMLLALGAPLLWYLRAEFVLQSDAINWGTAAWWGPTFGALAVSQHDYLLRPAWIFAGGHVALGIVALMVGRIARRRRG
jgi:hypothetical protein